MTSAVAMMSLLCTTMLLTIQVDATSLNAMLSDKVTVLNSLASSAESYQYSRCGDLLKCRDDSTSCSVPACGTRSFTAMKDDHGFECNSLFGSDPSMCGGGCDGGLHRSTTSTVVRLAPKSDFSNSWELQAFICTSKRLETDFITFLNDKKLEAWQYFGGNTGAIRIYPGAPQDRSEGKCSDYDPRLRPWYIAASSGPKDVVIVIDVSGSMADPNSLFTPDFSRLDAVKVAVKAILDSLTRYDFVQVVQFSATAAPLYGTALLRADEANIAKLKSEVDRLSPRTDTYFIPGLDAAFNVLRTSTERTTKCSRVMLFLTDGKAAESESAVLSAISTHQSALGTNKAHLFTYSMSSAATNDIPRAMACANNGIWASITNGEDPLAEMGQYYQFLARGIDDSTVRWTTPYEDAFGLGQMVTAARAVYDRSNSVPLLVGVVGTDITMKELQSFGDSFDKVMNELLSIGATCPVLSLAECEMQNLRKQAGYECPAFKSVATCEAGSEIAKLSPCTAVTNGVNNLLCEELSSSTRLSVSTPSLSTKDVTCCSDGCDDTDDDANNNALIIAVVVVGIVCVTVVAVAFVVFRYKRSTAREEEEEQSGAAQHQQMRMRRSSASRRHPTHDDADAHRERDAGSSYPVADSAPPGVVAESYGYPVPYGYPQQAEKSTEV